jgi:hypothetical protein
MTVLAMGFLHLPLPAFDVPVVSVISVRANEKMLRIKARRIVAAMKHSQRRIKVEP